MFEALLTILWDEPIDQYEDAGSARASATPIPAPDPSALFATRRRPRRHGPHE
jgi:hypothetical protein